MEYDFYTLGVLYLVYSFAGWVGETVVATVRGKHFANRGAAAGPFCFVYGTAGVLITIGLNDQRASLAALFFGSMIYATWASRTCAATRCTSSLPVRWPPRSWSG